MEKEEVIIWYIMLLICSITVSSIAIYMTQKDSKIDGRKLAGDDILLVYLLGLFVWPIMLVLILVDLQLYLKELWKRKRKN